MQRGRLVDALQHANPDIPQKHLLLLICLIIDFWWSGEVDQDYSDDEGLTSVKLGDKHCPKYMPAQMLKQYVIFVQGRRYLVVDNDIELRDGQILPASDPTIEVGLCPALRPGEDFPEQDMRRSDEYREILSLLQPIPAKWKFDPALEADWEAKGWAGYDEARCIHRAPVLLGRAWKMSYLLLIWHGIRIDEATWQAVISQVLKIPSNPQNPSGSGVSKPLAWCDVVQKYTRSQGYPDQDDDLIDRLQIMIILQIAKQMCRGDQPGNLKDPLNCKSPEFLHALDHFSELPGLRTQAKSLRVMKERIINAGGPLPSIGDDDYY